MCCFRRTDAKYFLVLYAIIAYFFSLKMVWRDHRALGPCTLQFGPT
jgi:hypothetical protein